MARDWASYIASGGAGQSVQPSAQTQTGQAPEWNTNNIRNQIQNQFGYGTDTFNQGQYDKALYGAAVQQAYADGSATNDVELKGLIDNYYNELADGTNVLSGRSIRGDNIFWDATGNARKALQDAYTGIGGALDTTLDAGADMYGSFTGDKETAQNWKDFTNADNLSLAGAIGTDAISLIPVAGPVLGGIKGAIESEDDWRRALTGIDPITGEDLTGAQQLTSLGAAGLNTALGAAPGVGTTKAFAKPIGKEAVESFVAKNGDEVLKPLADKLTDAKQAYKDVLKNTPKDTKNAVLNVPKGEQVTKKSMQEAIDNLGPRANVIYKGKKIDIDKLPKPNPNFNNALTEAKQKAIDKAVARNNKIDAALAQNKKIDDATNILNAYVARDAAREANAKAIAAQNEKAADIINQFQSNNPIQIGRALAENPDLVAKRIKGTLGKEPAKEAAKETDKNATKALTADEIFEEAAKEKGGSYLDAIKNIMSKSKGSKEELAKNKKGGLKLGLKNFALGSGNMALQEASDTGESIPMASVDAMKDVANNPDALVPWLLVSMLGPRTRYARMSGGSNMPYTAMKAKRMGDLVNIGNYGSVPAPTDETQLLFDRLNAGDTFQQAINTITNNKEES